MAEKEYIERNELIGNLKMFAPEYYSDLINDLIIKQPAADVEPVRHGHWCDGFNEYCSECGKEIEYNDFYKYCPHCGAKMDGEDGDKNA